MVLQAFDAWRTHKIFHKLFKQAWPGLNRALVIFAGYCLFDFATIAAGGDDHHHVDVTAHGPTDWELVQAGTSKAEVFEDATGHALHGERV
jgi:hypothetical protein